MGVENEIIVALEFGTSAIRGIAGKKKPDGTIQILAIEQERANDAIQRGVIYNIDKTTLAITNIVQRINERLHAKIVRAFVGVSGQSLHSATNSISRGLEMKVKITPELVDNLMDNNRATPYTDSQILDVVPQEYVVGNRSIADPVGIQSDLIEANFINVIARNALLENIHRCMRMAGIEIADLFISPMTLADALLSDSEKRSGCAMIDFGAGTTSVAVYNGNILRHLAVIPLGGNNITADIATSQQMEFEDAETLKRKYGIAYVAAESDNPQMLPISNDRTLSENDLQYIIGARQEEIIMNAWNQIKNVSDRLLSGIIITGGAAQLQDIPEAIKHFTQFQKVKMAKSLITMAEVAPEVIAPQGISIDTLIAMLSKGNTNCVEGIDGQPIADGGLEDSPKIDENGEETTENEQTSSETPTVNKKPKKPLWDRFANLMQDMFVEKDDEQETK